MWISKKTCMSTKKYEIYTTDAEKCRCKQTHSYLEGLYSGKKFPVKSFRKFSGNFRTHNPMVNGCKC